MHKSKDSIPGALRPIKINHVQNPTTSQHLHCQSLAQATIDPTPLWTQPTSWSPSPSRLSVINTATRMVLWKHKADDITSRLNMFWWLSVSGQKRSTDPTGAHCSLLGPYFLVSIPPTLLAAFQTDRSLGDIAWTSSSLFSLFPHKSIFQSLSPSVTITSHWVLLCPRQSSNSLLPTPWLHSVFMKYSSASNMVYYSCILIIISPLE